MGQNEIAFVITHNGNGGSQILWENLASEFSTRGYRPTLISLYQPSVEETRAAWKPILTRDMSSADIPAVVSRLVEELRRVKPHAIISALPAANALSSFAGAIAGVRRRVTTHHTPSQTYGSLIRSLEKYVGSSRATTAAVSVSEGVRRSFDAYPSAYTKKMRVIRNALNAQTTEAIDAILLGRVTDSAPKGPKLILAAGRLSAQKNYETLILAMKRVNGAELYIAGEGPDRTRLEGLAQSSGVAKAVKFLGHRTHGEILQLMSGVDIFVQPSLYEGHSIALLEAAAFGLPLVVSDADTQIEAITSSAGTLHGQYAPTLNAELLAEKLNLLITDDALRARMSEAALALSKELTFSSLVDGYVGLVE